MVGRIRLFVLALASLVVIQCKAKDIFDRYFTCDPDETGNTCGTNREGASMVCFAGSRYGAADFCADPCAAGQSDASFRCRDAASLRACDPKSALSGCPDGLTCVDIDAGQGACLLPCSKAGGCAAVTLRPASDGGVTPCSGGANACPTTSEGKPMICVTSSSLGGDDFCTEECDPEQRPLDPDNFRCLASGSSGALLRRCHPNQSDAGAAGCPGGLNCFRTSLLSDDGVCMAMPVCESDRDCKGMTRTTCAATVLRGSSSSLTSILPLNHLNRLINQCAELHRPCGSSEGCLGTQYSISVADICVPNCDAHLHCPPNFSCAFVVSGDGAQRLCLPGVPGSRCEGDNCIFGECEDTGAGFSTCTRPCNADVDCSYLSTDGDPFVCVEGPEGRHCVTPRPFNGANCQSTDDCRVDAGQFCSREAQLGFSTGHGECRLPCKGDGTCDTQGGLAFSCLSINGGCLPGVLGMPCTLPSECVSGLSCQDVPPEPDVTSNARICTASCAIDGGTDAEGDVLCSDTHSIRQRGYCSEGVCRSPRVAGEPCNRASQCASLLCASGTNLCVNPPADPSGI
jgi:hypothetical protein